MTEYCDGGIAQNVVSRAAGHRRTATAASATASTPMPSLVSAVASTNSKRRLKRATTPFIVSIAEPEVTQVHEHVYYMTDPEADSDNEPIPGASIVDTLSSSSSSSSSDSDNDDNDSANSLDYYVRRRTIKGKDDRATRQHKRNEPRSAFLRSKSPPPPSRPIRSEKRIQSEGRTRPRMTASEMRVNSTGHVNGGETQSNTLKTENHVRPRSSSVSAAESTTVTSRMLSKHSKSTESPSKASAKLNRLLESANAFNVDSEQSDDNNSGGGKKNKHNLADDSSDNSEPIANLSSKFAMKLAKLNTNPAVLAHGATNNANQGSTTQAATNSTSPILPATSMVMSPEPVTSPSLVPRALPLSEIVPSTSSSSNGNSSSESEDTSEEDTDSGSNIQNPHLSTNSRYTSGALSSSPSHQRAMTAAARPPVNPSITSWLNGIQSPPLPVPTTSTSSYNGNNSGSLSYPLRPPDSSSDDDNADADDDNAADDDDDDDDDDKDSSHALNNKAATDSDDEVIGRYSTKPARVPPAPLAIKTVSSASTTDSADLPLISSLNNNNNNNSTTVPANSSPLSPHALHRSTITSMTNSRQQHEYTSNRNPPASHKPRREASYDPTASRRKHSMENVRDINLSSTSTMPATSAGCRNPGKRQDLRPTFSPPSSLPPDSPTFMPLSGGGSPLLRPAMLRVSSNHQQSVRRVGSGVLSGPSSPSSIASASEDDDVALGHRNPEIRRHASSNGLNRLTSPTGAVAVGKPSTHLRRVTRDREERRAAAEPRRLIDNTERRSKREKERRQAEEVRRHNERSKHYDRHRKMLDSEEDGPRTRSVERRANAPEAPVTLLNMTTTTPTAAITTSNTASNGNSNNSNTKATLISMVNSTNGNTQRVRGSRPSTERESDTRRQERSTASNNQPTATTYTTDSEEKRVERKPSRRSSTRSNDRSRRGDNYGNGHNAALAPPLPISGTASTSAGAPVTMTSTTTTTSVARKSQEVIRTSTDEAAISDELAANLDHKTALAAVVSKDMVGADGKPIQTVKAAKARVAANVAATVAASKQQDPVVRKVMATIFVDNADTKYTVQLTSTMTTVDTIKMMREANQITDDDPTWTIFELINDFGAERPIADWETITDVLSTWDASQNNGLVARKSAFRTGLSCSGLVTGFPQYMAKLSMDKNRKWQKRNFYTRDAAIYYSKDKKCKDETLFCYLSNHEAYTMTVAHTKAPTDYVFAFKSQESIRIFEKPERDYIHFVCADNVVQLREWLLCIRSIKRQLKFAESPELFPDAFAASQTKATQGDSILGDSILGSLGISSSILSASVGNGAAAGSLLAAVDSLVQAKETDKDKEDDEKPAASQLPNVFKPGSLLAEMKPIDPNAHEEEEKEGDAITNARFTEGSLLNDIKAIAPARQPSDDEDDAPALTFKSGTLLAVADKTAQSAKEARETEEKAPMQFKSGSLLSGGLQKTTDTRDVEEKTLLQFKSGSLLSEGLTKNEGPSVEDKHALQFKSGSLLSDATTRTDLLPDERRVINHSGTSAGGTLLRIDLKREEGHTEKLKKTGRYKPLIDFSEQGPPKPVAPKKTPQPQISNYKGKPLLNFNGHDGDNDSSSEGSDEDDNEDEDASDGSSSSSSSSSSSDSE